MSDTNAQKESKILPRKFPKTSVCAQIRYKMKSYKDYKFPDKTTLTHWTEDIWHETITMLKPYGEEKSKCKSCKKSFRYTKPKFGEIKNIACSFDCAKVLGFTGKFDISKYMLTHESKNKTKEHNICPKCGGKARGRGYSHTEDCPETLAKKKANKNNKSLICPECGGKKRGRGYTHKEKCKLSCSWIIDSKQKPIP